MFQRFVLCSSLALGLVCCGSSDDDSSASGLNSSSKISELSSGDLEKLCGWAEDAMAACPEEFGTVAECATLLGESGCTASVSKTEGCVEAMVKQSCEDPMKVTACEGVTPCFTPKEDLPHTNSAS